MKRNRPTQSALWELINKTYITEDQIHDLAGFKSSKVNFKLALWDPQTNGVRYLKALVYNLCTSMTSENWERLSRIRNRQFGDPITVRFNGQEICLDYLQAVYELEFLAASLSVDGLSILEIGAGYGRTCHAVLSNHEVKAYYIIDLDNSLNLSKGYLEAVLDRTSLAKIHFLPIEEIDVLHKLNFDLCVNIDSFAEMRPDVVRYYLNYVDEHCGYFYIKNPVGKYLDSTLSISQENDEVELALSTGLLREVIDIHDNQVVEQHGQDFVQTYRPSDRWACIRDSWARPWSYYWQAIYKK